MILKIKFIIIMIIAMIQSEKCYTEIYDTTYIDNRKNQFYYYKMINNHDFFQEEKKLLHNNHTRCLLKYLINQKNTVITSPYHNKLPLFFFKKNKSKLHIQNDSINISYIFYNHKNNYQKIIPFMQLGLQKILSEKVISIGGGNRYVYNQLYAVGYNIFYHYPISPIFSVVNIITPNQQPYINISGEYWYHNMLFMLNSFYRTNKSVNSEKNFKNNKKYPTSGYQIYIENKFLKFLELTGKITLEHFFYKKNKNKNYLNKNMAYNYCLTLSLEYYPIPIVGCNINKIFTNQKKYNDTIYQILIDYQFNIPIIQQTCHTRNNKKNPSIFLYLNETIQSFAPIFLNVNNKNDDNYTDNTEDNISKNCCQKISGYPGEIKIIAINTKTKNDKMQKDVLIQWNVQSLQTLYKYGGNITLLNAKKNIYAIQIPHQLIIKNNTCMISYIIVNNDNITHNYKSNAENKIFITMQKFQQKKLPKHSLQSTNSHVSNTITTIEHNPCTENIIQKDQHTHLLKDEKVSNTSSIITDNSVSSIISEHRQSPPIVHDNTHLIKKEKIIQNPLIISHQENNDINTQQHINVSVESSLAKKDTTTKTTQYATPPIPPPLPVLLPATLLSSPKASTSSSHFFIHTKPMTTSQQDTKSDSCSSTIHHACDDKNCHTTQTKLHLASKLSIQIEQDNIINNVVSNISKKTNNQNLSLAENNENLLFLLSAHKKSKFSAVGTTEHINKLENFTVNKKSRTLSEMEQIFSKLRLTQSTSSIDEPYCTTDDSE